MVVDAKSGWSGWIPEVTRKVASAAASSVRFQITTEEEEEAESVATTDEPGARTNLRGSRPA